MILNHGGTKMLVTDVVNMNNHDKQTIYEAYSLETAVRKQLNVQLNDERKVSAQMKYERDKYMDDWLRLHIEKHVTVEGDMQEALDGYFNDINRQVFFTPSGGYCCVMQEEDCLFIVFAWHNPKKWRAEVRDMTELIKHIAQYAQMPIRYTGVTNIFKNHSVEIEEGLWELKLN